MKGSIMNTASLELSKELYKLSGWDDVHFFYNQEGKIQTVFINYNGDVIPAYDLGYLLRKLQTLSDKPDEPNIRLDFGDRRPGLEWAIRLYYNMNIDFRCLADTPEDAACKLAIELFKQGVLK